MKLLPHEHGALLPVKVELGARRREIKRWQGGRLKVTVQAAPEQGKANRAAIVLLARSLGLRKSQIEVLSGITSREKTLLVRKVSAERLADLLFMLPGT